MATAPTDEFNRAIDRFLYLSSAQPAWVENYINKYNGGKHPLLPWPPEQDELDRFLTASEPLFHTKEDRETLVNVIDPKKRQALVEDFDLEYEKVKNARSAAELAAKKRVEEVIKHTLKESTVDPNQKDVLFKELASQSERQPTKPVEALVPDAVSFGEAAQPFLQPDVATQTQGPLSFTQIKSLSPVQKAVVAPLLDVVTTVFPNLRQGEMNRDFEDAFKKLIDVPDRLTKLFGKGVVDSTLFQQMLGSAQKALPTGSRPGGAKTIIDDVASSLFHHAPEPALVAYWELYRTNLAQGLPPPSLAQFQASSMGLGSSLFHMGVGIGVDKAKGWAIGKGLTALGVKLAIPGAGWAALALQLGAGLIGKVGGWLKGLVGIKPGEVPGDRWILGVGCSTILLIFFILPIVSQLNIDSSLATRFAGGPETPGGAAPSFPPYGGAPLIPSEITGCPTKNAYPLTQCPTGTYSHGRLYAYDLGIPMGIPIVAAHSGVIAVTTNAAQSGGYGNMIEIKGVTPGGQAYYTLYGHLASFSVVPGRQVRAGDIIGFSDNTGNSSGPHLHFEYRGPSNTASPDYGVQFLPAACTTNPGMCNLK